jgi:GntR family transcriptional regulator
MFGVSRHVVRMALAELAKEGLIRTERGRGSFGNPPKEIHPITTLTSLHRLMAERKLEMTIQVVRNRVTRASRLLAKKLNLAPGERVAELVRAAHIGGKPAMLMVSFIPETLCPDMRHQDMSTQSLYAYLEKTCSVRLVHAQNYIEVAFASREQGRHLGVPQGSSLLLIEGLVYGQKGRPVELSSVYYRADRFRLFFESSRPRGAGDGKVRLV